MKGRKKVNDSKEVVRIKNNTKGLKSADDKTLQAPKDVLLEYSRSGNGCKLLVQAGCEEEFDSILEDRSEGQDIRVLEVATTCASRMACCSVEGAREFKRGSLSTCSKKVSKGNNFKEKLKIMKAVRLFARAHPGKADLFSTSEWLAGALSWFVDPASPWHRDSVLLLESLRTCAALPGLVLTAPTTATMLVSTVDEGLADGPCFGLRLLNQVVESALEQLEGGALLEAAEAWLLELEEQGIVGKLLEGLEVCSNAHGSFDTAVCTLAMLSTLTSCLQSLRNKGCVQALIDGALLAGRGQEHARLLLERVLSDPVGVIAFDQAGGLSSCLKLLKLQKDDAGLHVCASVVLILGCWAKHITLPIEAFTCTLDATPLISFLECSEEDVANAARMVLTLYCSDTQLLDWSDVPVQSDDGPVQTFVAMFASPVYGDAELLKATNCAIRHTMTSEDSCFAFIKAGLMTHIGDALRGNCQYVDFQRAVDCLCGLLPWIRKAVDHLVCEVTADVVILLLDRLTEQQDVMDDRFNTEGAFMVMHNMLHVHNNCRRPVGVKTKARQARIQKGLMMGVIQKEGRVSALLKVTLLP
jgi:hypothetical protein